MAAQAERQVARSEHIFAVPKLSAEAQTQEERLKQGLQLRFVDQIIEMVELARRQRPDLPIIDRNSFSLTIPNLAGGGREPPDVVVVQSAGFIFTANMRDGTISVYGKESKVTMG